ncbi:MAG: Nramp family divalent metal transporter [Thaumarchaeota archaeon]|nr:Nramp family divalent metal transporter [Nitrososphaerota archaeon]
MTGAQDRSLKPPEPTQKPEVTERQKNNPHISVRDFFTYLGPTLIVSLAYVDPGNFGTDIAGGSQYNYALIWSVWMASAFAMVLQYLSGKLGIATGNSLTQLIRVSLKSRARIVPYWLGAEIAIAATDLAEYLGTVIALNILFGIPLLYASIFGALDVIILLALTSNRFRVVEYFFMVFVSVIAIGFLYELLRVGPNLNQFVIGSISPDISSGTLLVVVGIVGATVMPHALWLHSSLTSTKLTRWGIKENDHAPKRKLLGLHLRENIVILAIAGCVNVAILVMAAAAFYGHGYTNIQQISDAFNVLKPLFGPLAAIVFAITLLASGIASSVVGTLAGQEVMTSLLGVKVNPYLRRIVTRGINVFPTTACILLGISPLALLFYSQVFLSILIPLPMIPLIWYTSKRKIMGPFVNRHPTAIIALAVGGMIIALNIALIYTSI